MNGQGGYRVRREVMSSWKWSICLDERRPLESRSWSHGILEEWLARTGDLRRYCFRYVYQDLLASAAALVLLVVVADPIFASQPQIGAFVLAGVRIRVFSSRAAPLYQ